MARTNRRVARPRSKDTKAIDFGANHSEANDSEPNDSEAKHIASSDTASTDAELRPRATRRSLPITLLRAREAVMARFRPIFAEHGVTDQQWRAIRVLGEAGPLDATELSERCCILTQSMTRIVRSMEERGLVVRRRDQNDARRLVIELTPASRALLERITPRSREIYRELEARYGAERIDLLLDMLDELAKTRPES